MSSFTVYKPVTTSSDASRTWAAAVLSDLPIAVRFCETACKDKGVVSAETDVEGRHFRQAFHIGAKYGARFTIHLYQGATLADLNHAKQMIARLKDGIVCDQLWPEFKSGAGRYMNSWLPHEPEKWSPELRPCTDPNCVQDWHEWETSGDTYQTEACEHDAIRTDHYTVVLQRHEGSAWTVVSWQACDQFEGPEGLKALRDWQNDLAYLQAQCDKLNIVSPVMEAAA